MILERHFLTLSSSLGEKMSFTTASIRKITASTMMMFLILNAITVKASRSPSFPVEPEGV